ncbi:ImmA/IrrE family metallo-endopeptidase [Janthinobacterium aestuarii]
MTSSPAKTLYDNLKAFGLTRAQVRKLLPQWWSPEAETSPDGYAELCGLISRRLSLDFGHLLNGDVVRKTNATRLAYKHNAAATPQSLQGATSIAISLAEAVNAAMSGRPTDLPVKASQFARRIRVANNDIVSLEGLIRICWESGIPVVPMPNLPVGVRKMDGAVINTVHRPVIIISKKRTSRAWLAFILAHELGHIGCGHLLKSGSIIDVSLQEQTTFEAESSTDKQELEADRYALELLGGQAADDAVSGWSSWISPVEIAVRAREAHHAVHVESGHLILRYAFQSKRWSECMTAMNFLSEDANAEALMLSALADNLDLDLIADDLKDLVMQVTGMPESTAA